jgi:hypothetical protein
MHHYQVEARLVQRNLPAFTVDALSDIALGLEADSKILFDESNHNKKHDNTRYSEKPLSITCWNCGGKGHKADSCFKGKKSNVNTSGNNVERQQDGNNTALKCYICGDLDHLAN